MKYRISREASQDIENIWLLNISQKTQNQVKITAEFEQDIFVLE